MFSKCYLASLFCSLKLSVSNGQVLLRMGAHECPAEDHDLISSICLELMEPKSGIRCDRL